MGICDEWSYVRTSQLLAQTGHIHYVGWAEAIVGWQFYLAAAFIRIFGFSFTAARLSTLLIAVVTVFLMQRIMVRLGLTETSASIATLTLALSPLFMMLSATMMTDIPGFFAILICLYGCIRALQAQTDRTAILWLWFAIVSNAISGTSRPTAWLGILAVVPPTLWLLRRRRNVLLQGFIAQLAGFVSIVLVMRWFHHKLYYIDTFASLGNAAPDFATQLIMQLVQSIQMAAFLLLPVLIAFVWLVFRRPRGAAVVAAALTAILLLAGHRIAQLRFLFGPFWGEWINLHGVYDGNSVPSQPPILIGRYPHILIDLLVLVCILCTIITLVQLRSRLTPDASAPAAGSTPRAQAVLLLVPSSLCTIILLVLRIRIVGLIHERYFFPILFCGLVLLLLYHQDHIRKPLPSICFAFVALWGLYGIISTHNMFAFYRARVAIGNEVLASGVPPTSLAYGWEQDGWYELQQSAYVNNVNNATPNTFHLALHHPLDLCHAGTLTGSYLHLAPRYGIAFEPNLCDGPASFAPVTYSAWGIHTQPTLYVFKYPPPWKSEIDYGLPAPPPPLP